MIKPGIFLAGIMILFSGLPSFAQKEQSIPLSKAWQLAFDSYPGLSQKKAQISQTQYQKELAESDRLPQAQLQVQNSVGTYAGNTGALFPLPGIFNVSGARSVTGSSATSANFYGSAVADINLIGFGKINNAIKAADYRVQEAQSSFDAYHLALQAKVTHQYFDMLYNNANLLWANKNVKRVQQIMDIAKSLADAGLKPGADTSLAASSFLQILAERDGWSGRLNASKIAFTETVPIPTLAITLPDQAYLQVNRTIAVNDSVNASHPYLQVIQKQANVSMAQKKAAASQAFPTLSLIAGYGNRGSGIAPDGSVSGNYAAGFSNMSTNYLVGLGLTWNLTGIYTSNIQKKRLEQRVQESRFGYALESHQLNTRLGSTRSRIAEQYNQVAHNAGAVSKADQAYDLYLSRYQSGLISLTELLQIQSLLQQAEKNNIEAHGQLWDQLTLQAELTGDFTNLSNQF